MSHESLAAEIQKWFSDYVQTFVRCARGAGADVDALQSYFHVPASVTTDTTFLSGETWEKVRAILGAELAQLAQADYGDTKAIDTVLQVFNQRAALMSVTWSRSNRSGVEIQRFRASYWLADAGQGWRIFALAVHGAGA